AASDSKPDRNTFPPSNIIFSPQFVNHGNRTHSGRQFPYSSPLFFSGKANHPSHRRYGRAIPIPAELRLIIPAGILAVPVGDSSSLPSGDFGGAVVFWALKALRCCSASKQSGGSGAKTTGGGATAPVSEAAMTEVGGVLDPVSAFIPMRISSTSKQHAFFKFDELVGSWAGFVWSMAPLHWIRVIPSMLILFNLMYWNTWIWFFLGSSSMLVNV
ncbi:hypothetical protein EJB05_54546, partial [Eragrostis curvula]